MRHGETWEERRHDGRSPPTPDVDATQPILYATVLVLLALTFTLNIAAVLVRARIRRRHAGGVG